MICYPNAKINLGLRIISKRKNGLHNLESFFLPIRLCDILEFEITSSKSRINHITYSGIKFINKKTDLIIQAYNLLRKDFLLPNIKIHLHKRIPVGSGMGGGSSNASFMLIMLNKFFDLKINNLKLMEYACLLGSDCPFFLINTFSNVKGFGNQVIPRKMNLNNYHIVIIKPNFSCSTSYIFSQIDIQKSSSLLSPNKNNIKKWKKELVNDLEKVALKLYPELCEIKNYLYSMGAFYSSMTGSGSAIYGFFENAPPNIEYPNSWVWQGTV